MRLLKDKHRNDFGTPHCRVVKTAHEAEQGKYDLNLITEDVGLENPNTFGYGRAPKAGEEII